MKLSTCAINRLPNYIRAGEASWSRGKFWKWQIRSLFPLQPLLPAQMPIKTTRGRNDPPIHLQQSSVFLHLRVMELLLFVSSSPGCSQGLCVSWINVEGGGEGRGGGRERERAVERTERRTIQKRLEGRKYPHSSWVFCFLTCFWWCC